VEDRTEVPFSGGQVHELPCGDAAEKLLHTEMDNETRNTHCRIGSGNQ
jgi:hypothetical protein